MLEKVQGCSRKNQVHFPLPVPFILDAILRTLSGKLLPPPFEPLLPPFDSLFSEHPGTEVIGMSVQEGGEERIRTRGGMRRQVVESKYNLVACLLG